MKRLVIFLGLLLTLSPAHALTQENQELCTSLYELARSSMSMRQVGVEIVDAIATANSDIGRHIIIDAYSRPAYYTDAVREREETEFATEYYIYCVKSF